MLRVILAGNATRNDERVRERGRISERMRKTRGHLWLETHFLLVQCPTCPLNPHSQISFNANPPTLSYFSIDFQNHFSNFMNLNYGDFLCSSFSSPCADLLTLLVTEASLPSSVLLNLFLFLVPFLSHGYSYGVNQISFVESKVTSPKSPKSPPSNYLSSSVVTETKSVAKSPPHTTPSVMEVLGSSAFSFYGVAAQLCSLESFLFLVPFLSHGYSYGVNQISFVESKVTSPKSPKSPPSNYLSSSVVTETKSVAKSPPHTTPSVMEVLGSSAFSFYVAEAFTLNISEDLQKKMM
ncbi:LOW QUALITY PROTEIN: hypothetical protein HID58_015925 [Brassica napus]|uniref:Uncharacterized protein n=1 Tax=Brassica napus TaxID=3708 RepID=A0ABQ8DLU8_BRANA|nr:LOW QUALITY PROTEIN: hypothetical protein HID58_015925 [Brassica napus]